MRSDITPNVLHPAQHKCLSPTGVIPITEYYTTVVWDLIGLQGSRFEGASMLLRGFVLPVLFKASAYGFFGGSCPAGETYGPFNDFDRTFHLLLAGVPRVFLRNHVEGLATMHRLFEEYFDGPHKDASEFVLANEQVVRDQGYVCFRSIPAINF